MIGRVSQQSMITEFSANNMQRESDLADVENQLSSGFRVTLPEQDPVATVNYMDYDSRLKEIETYSEIINTMDGKINLIDSQLSSATEIIQRARELAVQLGNGIYSDEDRVNAAMEVDQLARELVLIGNSYWTDTTLFGGTMITEDPFVSEFETDPDTGTEFLSGVKYMGNEQSQSIQIERGETVTIAQPGNQVFWAGNMMVIPTKTVTGYTAPMDSTIVVDGLEISVSSGDNLEMIAEKINNSGAAVNASILTENQESIFMIESTDAHQVTLRDIDGGSVLQDLGLIDAGTNPPYNYASDAYVYTGSIFDAMIEFRDALLTNDSESIGGDILGKMDLSLDNVLTYRAHVGAVSERLETITERYLNDEVYYSDLKMDAIGTDIAEATMEMKLLEFAHEVALNIGARLMPMTLLDFLR